MIYAIVTDNTWWNDNSPYSYENELEEIVYYTWEEYLTVNGKIWKTFSFDNTKEYVTFSRSGRPVDIGSYTSEKISFVTELDYKSNINNTPYYLLYNNLREKDWYRKPIDIDFKRNLTEPLYPRVEVQNYLSPPIDVTVFYSEETYENKVLEEWDYEGYTHIYWYTNFGRDEGYKYYKRTPLYKTIIENE